MFRLREKFRDDAGAAGAAGAASAASRAAATAATAAYGKQETEEQLEKGREARYKGDQAAVNQAASHRKYGNAVGDMASELKEGLANARRSAAESGDENKPDNISDNQNSNAGEANGKPNPRGSGSPGSAQNSLVAAFLELFHNLAEMCRVLNDPDASDEKKEDAWNGYWRNINQEIPGCQLTPTEAIVVNGAVKGLEKIKTSWEKRKSQADPAVSPGAEAESDAENANPNSALNADAENAAPAPGAAPGSNT